MGDPGMLSVSEAAARLGVSAKTLRRYADAGKVPYTRLPSGHRRFRSDAIDALAREVEPRPSVDPVNADDEKANDDPPR